MACTKGAAGWKEKESDEAKRGQEAKRRKRREKAREEEEASPWFKGDEKTREKEGRRDRRANRSPGDAKAAKLLATATRNKGNDAGEKSRLKGSHSIVTRRFSLTLESVV